MKKEKTTQNASKEVFDLQATTQKSYYKKAIVILEDGEKLLQSYDTIVCKIDKHNKFVKLWRGYSDTTKHHINDFRKLYNLPPLNKKEWKNMQPKNTTQFVVVCVGAYHTYEYKSYFETYEQAQKYLEELEERDKTRVQNGICYYDIIEK